MEKKKGLNHIMGLCEQSQQRYLDNESFIKIYLSLPFWKRIFYGKYIMNNHLIAMKKKYPNLLEE